LTLILGRAGNWLTGWERGSIGENKMSKSEGRKKLKNSDWQLIYAAENSIGIRRLLERKLD